MSKFRKKPVTIDAVRWDGSIEAQAQIAEWNPESIFGADDKSVQIPTLEGTMTATLGDYVIRGVAGEVYPCKPDIFDACYEPMTESPEF